MKIITAKDDIFNRRALERGGFDVLLSPEAGQRRDTLRQMDSGLNHVLAAIAKKKSISIGVNMGELQSLKPVEKARRLTRIRQNVRICRKEKIPLVFIGEKNESDFVLLSLGASTKQAQKART